MLFLCTGNSCRSQMAEGWTHYYMSPYINVYSAGIETHGLNPMAVKVMAEAGVDISKYVSTTIHDLSEKEFDYVITVCDSARENCPWFPAKTKLIHHGFEDPPYLARNAKNEEEALVYYRRIRDEIREYVEELPKVPNLHIS